MSNKRHERGTNRGGQFASHDRSDPDGISLSGESDEDQRILQVDACVNSDNIERFLSDESWFVRAECASHAHASESQLERLARDENWMVRYTVACRPDTQVYRQLLSDPDPRVAAMAAENPAATTAERDYVRSRPDVQDLMLAVSTN